MFCNRIDVCTCKTIKNWIYQWNIEKTVYY